jgi:hypothetical protein
MNIKSWLAAASFCLLPLTANAGVIYEWQALNDQTPQGITLQLEFDQSTVNSGAFSFNLRDFEIGERPAGGLLSLRYEFAPINGDGLMTYTNKDGFDGDPDGMYGLLEMDLRFEAGGFLSGFIYANDIEQHFGMASDGNIFTVFTADSDGGMESCGWLTEVECGGAAGYLRRADMASPGNEVPDSGTEVPEPGTLALLGLGALAASRGRRRR